MTKRANVRKKKSRTTLMYTAAYSTLHLNNNNDRLDNHDMTIIRKYGHLQWTEPNHVIILPTVRYCTVSIHTG